MTTVNEAPEAHSKNVRTFLQKYRPAEQGTPEYSQWVEDVRMISIGAQASFYTSVLKGSLRDEGLPFLRSAMGTFGDFIIMEAPELPEAPNYLQDMENVFTEPHDADVHIAYALRALAQQSEKVTDALWHVQDRLLEANNL